MTDDRKDQTNQTQIQEHTQASDQGKDFKELEEIDKKLMLKNRIINLSLFFISCSFVFFVWILTHSDYYENHPEATSPVLDFLKSIQEAVAYLLKG